MDNFFTGYPNGGGVTSLNSLTGALSLVAGTGITITPSGNMLTIAASGGGGGANTALSNLTSPTAINQNLIPDSQAVRDLGEISSGLTWLNAYVDFISSGTHGNNLNLLTQPRSGGNPTENINLTTGNSVSGNTGSISVTTGDSGGAPAGNIVLQVGTGTGSSSIILNATNNGNIALQNGTQGFTGQVWTSIDGNGNGAWMASGGLPAPLEAVALYTPNETSQPGTFLGNDSDSDQTYFSIALGSTDTATAANNTSSVTLIAGDNTASKSTGNAGSIHILAGSVTSGAGNPGNINLVAGTSSSAATRASVNITGGAAPGNAGAVNITGGTSSGSGDGGAVVLTAGASSSGNGGNISLTTGTGTTPGSINLNAATTIGQNSTTLQHALNTALGTNASGVLTLTNAPAGVAGNPAGYISIVINGTPRFIPFW